MKATRSAICSASMMGKIRHPSRSRPSRMARTSPPSDQAPMPVSGSGVRFEPYKKPKPGPISVASNSRPPAWGSPGLRLPWDP